jgi:acetolactate synthase I/II/III large subunit
MPAGNELCTGAEAVTRVLARETRFVFGLPGGHMMRVFDQLRDVSDSVRTVLVREESLGSVMAEAYGRLAGEPCVVMGQGAWLLGNAGIGIMEALLGSSPVVILGDTSEGGALSHHGPYQSGSGDYGTYDLRAAMAAITKRTFYALYPAQAAQLTQLAFKHATTGTPGPVAVLFHSNALTGMVAADGVPRVRFDRSYANQARLVPAPDDITAAHSALAAARRPVVIAGNGIRLSGASEALLQLVEQTELPVVTTAGGKGVFPENHPLAGGVIGTFGQDSANDLVAEADVILAVGTRLGATDTANENPALIDADRQTLIQADVEPLNVGWTNPAAIHILGDAREVLTGIAKAALDMRAGGHTRVQTVRRRAGYFDQIQPSERGVRGRRVAQILARELPDRSIVTCDAGENRIFMLHDYQTRSASSFLQPNGGGGMGYAIPAAIAAHFAYPDRMAVAVCGDGGFAMTLHGLITAVEQEVPIKVIVMNNNALGWVLNATDGEPFASTFPELDLAGIATAIGCTARVVHDEDSLAAAVRDMVSHPGVCVVVVDTNLEDRYSDVRSSLARSAPVA